MLGFGNKKENTQNFFGASKSNSTAGMNQNHQTGGGQMAIPGGEPQPRMEQANQQMGMEGNEQELQAYIDQRTNEIDNQVKEFSQKNPNFDMGKEMQNPQFCTYIWGNGLSVEDAYYLAHKNEADNSNQKNSNYYQSSNQRRISENGTGRQAGNGMVKKNPKDLSDDEVDDIVKRVRDGEKISF